MYTHICQSMTNSMYIASKYCFKGCKCGHDFPSLTVNKSMSSWNMRRKLKAYHSNEVANVLQQVEWSMLETRPTCPECGHSSSHPHDISLLHSDSAGSVVIGSNTLHFVDVQVHSVSLSQHQQGERRDRAIKSDREPSKVDPPTCVWRNQTKPAASVL